MLSGEVLIFMYIRRNPDLDLMYCPIRICFQSSVFSEQVHARPVHLQDRDPLMSGEPLLVHQLFHVLILPTLLSGITDNYWKCSYASSLSSVGWSIGPSVISFFNGPKRTFQINWYESWLDVRILLNGAVLNFYLLCTTLSILLCPSICPTHFRPRTLYTDGGYPPSRYQVLPDLPNYPAQFFTFYLYRQLNLLN